MKEACIQIKNTPEALTNHEWHFHSYESGVYTKEACTRMRGILCAILTCAPFICVTRPIFMCVTLPILMCGVWWFSFWYSPNKIWRRRVNESRVAQCMFMNRACIRISALTLLLSHMLTSTLAILVSSSLPLVLSSPLLSLYLALALTIKHAQAAIDEAVTAAVDAVRLQTKNELEVPCFSMCIHHTHVTSYSCKLKAYNHTEPLNT